MLTNEQNLDLTRFYYDKLGSMKWENMKVAISSIDARGVIHINDNMYAECNNDDTIYITFKNKNHIFMMTYIRLSKTFNLTIRTKTVLLVNAQVDNSTYDKNNPQPKFVVDGVKSKFNSRLYDIIKASIECVYLVIDNIIKNVDNVEQAKETIDKFFESYNKINIAYPKP